MPTAGPDGLVVFRTRSGDLCKRQGWGCPLLVTNWVSADLWPPGGSPKLEVCQAVVKDEVMCASFPVMGTARTRPEHAGTVELGRQNVGDVPDQCGSEAKNPSMKISTFPIGSVDSCRPSRSLASQNTCRHERVEGSAPACHPAFSSSKVTEWLRLSFDLI